MFVPAVQLPEDVSIDRARWIVVDERQQVMLRDGLIPSGPAAPVQSEQVHLLGVDDGTPIFAVGLSSRAIADDHAPADRAADDQVAGEWMHLRALFGVLSDTDWVLAGRATQVLTWARDHQFCGRCGATNEPHASDRALVCPSCGLMSFPRISPAVIMLVERDGVSGPEVLLAWGRQFPGRFFSALAGFVEPGESLEQCVVREVFEETAIEVDQVRYFGSQPWPFPHSMMIGFTARHVSGEISIQEAEIVEAGWFGPNELPPVPRGGMSIAGWLIEDWLRRISD